MTYPELVAALRARRAVPLRKIEAVLAAAGVTAERLVVDLFAAPQSQPGDPCERCQTGRLRVANTRRKTDRVIRYLACNECDHRPARNKLIEPLSRPVPIR